MGRRSNDRRSFFYAAERFYRPPDKEAGAAAASGIAAWHVPDMAPRSIKYFLKYFMLASRHIQQKEKMTGTSLIEAKLKSHTTRGFAMKAIFTLFAIGLIYYAVTMQYLANCLVA